tara:strand:- start:13 stop:972 length:960 start_codon:yes stop_codon:yes gene_type:complete
MLYRSGENLLEGAISFVNQNNDVTLFSAYLKLDTLKKVNESGHIKQIIVRWEIKDLCLGVSDFEKLVFYCQENQIALYRNTRLHAKVIWNNFNEVFLGSANITGKGLASLGNKYNFELNSLISNISIKDILYLKRILKQSEYVTKSLFEELTAAVNEEKAKGAIEYKELETRHHQEDSFLLSQLPMSESVNDLFDAYKNLNSLKDIDQYAIHDIVLYDISSSLDEVSFKNYLRQEFNNHPFVISLKEYIKIAPKQSLRYGEVVNWIRENTTTVPTPRNFEIKEKIIVNILYDWICFFDKDFTWDIPGARSQVIYYQKQR